MLRFDSLRHRPHLSAGAHEPKLKAKQLRSTVIGHHKDVRKPWQRSPAHRAVRLVPVLDG
jgi:hypothetical protein